MPPATGHVSSFQDFSIHLLVVQLIDFYMPFTADEQNHEVCSPLDIGWCLVHRKQLCQIVIKLCRLFTLESTVLSCSIISGSNSSFNNWSSSSSHCASTGRFFSISAALWA